MASLGRDLLQIILSNGVGWFQHLGSVVRWDSDSRFFPTMSLLQIQESSILCGQGRMSLVPCWAPWRLKLNEKKIRKLELVGICYLQLFDGKFGRRGMPGYIVRESRYFLVISTLPYSRLKFHKTL